MPLPTAPATARRPYSARARNTPGGRRGAGLALSLMVTLAACSGGHSDTSATSVPPSSGAASSVAATTGSASSSRPPSHSATHHAPSSPPATKKPTSCVDRTASAMSVSQRVGQLFMSAVTSTGMTGTESAAITRGKVGAVILMGHTSAGAAAVRAVTDQARSLTSAVPGVKLRMLVSTDQEGGQIQVLRGPGIDTIPSAVTQGTWSDSRLQGDARTWGRQLRAAGVTMNLAPVADTVPPALVGVNAPIGKLDREYGTDPTTVAGHSTAFLRGMLQAGVVPTVKHFPGLGRVRGNTDLTAGVTDSVTTRNDPYLLPFRSAIKAGTPFVMVSSATYSRIDAGRQAVFSPVVLRDMLRTQLGFKGVIITDDVGAAVAVSDRTPARRALDFLAAGGNMVLTVRPADIAPMTGAVITRLPADAALRRAVDDSVKRILTAKQNAGLLSC